MRDVCLPLAAQRGQALIESVLLLSLLTLLLHAALGLGGRSLRPCSWAIPAARPP